MADIFVSYAREDRARVLPFVDLLTEQGWSVWWDRALIPGNTFESVIDDEITGARCVLVFWSEHSVKSDWVLAEANDGLERRILIPVLLDEVRVPLVFRRKQAAFLIGWPARQDTSEIQRLIDAIGDLIRRPAQPVHIPLARQKLLDWKLALAGVFSLLIIAAGLMFSYQPEDQVASSRPETSITVLPFGGEGSLAELGFEVADVLREVESFYVTSGARAIEYSANDSKLKLDTRYVVRGEVISAEELTVSLYDGNDLMWTETVSMSGDDVSHAVNDIAARVAASFHKRLIIRDRKVPSAVYLSYLTAKAELRKPIATEGYMQARDKLLAVVESSPRFAEARAGLCEAHLLLFQHTKVPSEFEQAERHCHRAQTLSAGDSYVHSVMGLLYAEAGEYELSLKHLNDALESTPYSTDAKRALAWNYRKQQRFGDAEQILLTATAIEPNYWKNYQALAAVYFDTGKYAQAAEYFDRQTGLVLRKSKALTDKGAALFLLEDFDRAIESWELSLAEERSPVTLANLGSAYFFNGQFEQAANTYRMALDMSPENDRFWANVGESLMHSGEPDQDYFKRAVALAETRLDINPEDVEVISGLAVYHASLGNRSSSLAYVDRSLLLAGKDVYTVYDVAVARARLGDADETLELLRRLLEMGYSRTLIDRDANFSHLTLERTL